MLAVFALIEPTLRKSITLDNDTAFAQHALLKTICAMTTSFCDAYASWQKAGRKRQRHYTLLPRQIDIDKVSDEESNIILTANLTPRKCLVSRRHSSILKELAKRPSVRRAGRRWCNSSARACGVAAQSRIRRWDFRARGPMNGVTSETFDIGELEHRDAHVRR